MSTEPTSLFAVAALAAGLVEGSSVIRYYLLGIQQQDDGNSGKNRDGDNTVNNDEAASIPSVPMLAAHSVLYGVASVPLGILGASPGHIFLPNSLSPSSAIIKGDDGGDGAAAVSSKFATTDEEKSEVKDDKHRMRSNDIPPASNTPIVAGTGRGFGRLLRDENTKKMIHNKRQRHVEVKSASRDANNVKVHPGIAATTRHSSYNITASRYIATLDGAPLPTPLAEAMRRSRFMFIGAGIVSYAITQYLTNTRHNTVSYELDENCSHGYGNWINSRSISMWNERIKNGKSGEVDINILKQLKKLDADGSIIRDLSSKILTDENAAYFHKTGEAAYDGIYKALKWINLQLGKDLGEPPLSLIRHWKTTHMNTEAVDSQRLESTDEEQTIEGNDYSNDRGEDDEEKKTKDATVSSSMPDSQKPNVWNVTVTSVDVLGTSIRHLLVSTYRLASAIANVGRRGNSSSIKDVDEMNEDQSDQTDHVATMGRSEYKKGDNGDGVD